MNRRKPVEHFKEWVSSLDKLVVSICSRNSILSGLYYTFLSRAFHQEHKAVLAGRVAYSRDLGEMDGSSTSLRRNIHRIEKGLIMKPRRRVFALGYIDETVDLLAAILEPAGMDESLSPEIQWAVDVLNSYFSVLDTEHPKLRGAHDRFTSLCRTRRIGDPEEERKTPFQVKALGGLPKYADLYSLCQHRHSVRWYRDLAVPRNLVDQPLPSLPYPRAPATGSPSSFIFWKIPG